MARPKIYGERRVATAVRLPESIHCRLHDAAEDRDVSVNLLIVRAVTEYLDQLPSAAVALGAAGSRGSAASASKAKVVS